MNNIGSAYVDIRAITDQLAGDVRRAVESIRETITIHVDADVSQAAGQIQALAAENVPDQSVTIDANTLPAREEFDNMLDDMDGEGPTIRPDVDDSLAKAKLALLTRMREIRINVKANAGPLNAVGNALARMSGARVVTDNIKGLAHEFANIDKMVPGISKMALLIGSIGSSAITAVGGVLTLGSSLMSIVNMAGLVGPGMAAGFITGIATMMVALKDFSKQLPEVVAQYKTLATTIRTNFWDAARNPLREISQKLFPDFQKGLGDTGSALGRWTTNVAQALGASLTYNGRLSNMFKSLNTSIDTAATGSGLMADSLAILGEAGGAVLPRLAGWFNDISLKFNTFITDAANSGELQIWIDEGIRKLKDLGNIIKNTAGIFGSITEAARMAGSDGMQTLLTFVTNLNNQLSQADSIKNMATIFQGANTAASALGDGIGKILGAVGSAAPAIKSAFESVGGVVTLIADAISKIISNPEFQAGFTAMFDGIEKGFGALLPVIGEMGPKMGAFLSIIGSLAANIGGVLGAALQVALPLITALKQAIDPLIPVMGDALIQIIQALKPAFDSLTAVMLAVAPAITSIIQAVAPFIAQVVETLGPALPIIIAGVVGFAAAWKATIAVQGIIKGITTAMAAYRAGMTLATAVQTGFNLAVLANPVALIIAGIVAAIAALVAGVIWAYNNVGWFKDGVDAAFKFIGEAVGNVVSFWNTNVVPMFEAALKAAGDFFGGIGKWVGEAITNIQNFFGGVSAGADSAVSGFTGFFDAIGKGISDAFNGVVDFISNIINTIVTVISTGVQIYISIWVNAFNIIRDFFVNVWNGMVIVFSPIVELIGTIIKGVIDIVVAIWQVGWDIVSTVFIGIWTNLVSFFTPVIQGISDTITNIVNGIVTTWNTVWQSIVDFFTLVWNTMVAVYSPIIQGISDFIGSVVNGISSTWNSVWQGIVDFFTTVWNLMVAIYSPIIQSIMDTISTVVNNISSVWNTVWGAISNFFSTTWSNIVSFVTTYVNNVMSVINGVLNTISSIWNSTWNSISSFVSSVWNGIVNAISGFVNSVMTNVSNVLNAIGKIGGDILKSVANFPSLLVSAGSDLIRGLANGISDMVGFVVDKVKGVGASVVDGLKNFFGIKSPSRLMRDQIGKQLGAGLAIGIEQSVGKVVKATEKLAAAAVPDLADIVLPSIKPGSIEAINTPAVTRNNVTPSSTAQKDAFGNPIGTGSVTNVNFTVNPSAGLNEEQIGESAMNTLYWKLSSK